MMAQILADEGYSVRVVTWSRSSSGLGSKGRNVKFQRFRLSAPYGTKAFFGLLLWLGYCFVWLLTHEYDVVQPQNLDNLIPVLLARGVKRSAIVYDLADFYADAYLPQRSLLRGPVAKLERLALGQIDALIFVSELQETQTRQASLPANRAVIYNIPSESEIETAKQAADSPRPSGSYLMLFYAGTISRERCDYLVRLSGAVEDIQGMRLEVAGFGASSDVLERELRTKSNSHFLGPLRRDEVMTETAHCDCVVLPYDPSFKNYRVALSNKFFEAMAVSKALLAPRGTLMGRLIEEQKMGFVTDFSDRNALRKTLLEMVSRRDQLALMGERGRAAFEKYSSSVLRPRLSDLYRSLERSRHE